MLKPPSFRSSSQDWWTMPLEAKLVRLPGSEKRWLAQTGQIGFKKETTASSGTRKSKLQQLRSWELSLAAGNHHQLRGTVSVSLPAPRQRFSLLLCRGKISGDDGTSLVVQWLRIRTPDAGAQAQPLVRRLYPTWLNRVHMPRWKITDPTCRNQDPQSQINTLFFKRPKLKPNQKKHSKQKTWVSCCGQVW